MTQKSKHKNNGLPLSPEKAQSFCEKVFAEGESQILKQFQLNVERLNRKQKGNQDPCSDLNSTQTVNPAEKA